MTPPAILAGETTLEALMRGRVNPETPQRTKVEIRTQVRFDDTSPSHSTLLESLQLQLTYQAAVFNPDAETA